MKTKKTATGGRKKANVKDLPTSARQSRAVKGGLILSTDHSATGDGQPPNRLKK